MAEVDSPGTEQQSDFEKVQQVIQNEVKEHFAQLATSLKQELAPPAQRQSDQEVARQQLKEAIDPLYRADVDQARFVASDARDYVDFYNDNALAAVYKEDVEKTFQELVKAGRATSRSDILYYLRGREQQREPDKFSEREKAVKQRELERAGAASDLGANSAVREKADTDFKGFAERVNSGNADEVSVVVKEMEAALAGITF